MTAHALWHDVMRIPTLQFDTRGHIIRTFLRIAYNPVFKDRAEVVYEFLRAFLRSFLASERPALLAATLSSFFAARSVVLEGFVHSVNHFFSSSSLFLEAPSDSPAAAFRSELRFASLGGGTLLRTFSLSTTLQTFFRPHTNTPETACFLKTHPLVVGSTCSSANHRRRHSRTSDISAPPAKRTRKPFSRGRSPTIVPSTSIVCHVPAARIRCGRT
jgi:hypothetical protein